ncbi:MAG: PD-(D/E)XK nuclease family protein [Clostridia bacterium]|nr:PD-(D/E)XK nuclease family protein [Clostridia bacterium]MDY4082994.1 PD-(D/E)XK nuclease family protein [Eubacteriales bacterium]
MINIILTPILTSKPILKKIKENFDGKSRHLLIVPDRFTLSYEKSAIDFIGNNDESTQKEVLDYLGIRGSFELEVSSFSKLADRFLKRKALRLLDKQSEIMLLRKVIEENKDSLVCFGRAIKQASFAEEMYAAISQIRNSGVSVEQLQALDGKLDSKTQMKTRDIALLYSRYVQALQQGYVDGTSKLQAFANGIEDSELADYHIYLTDFTSLTRVEKDIVQAMMKTAMSFDACLLSSVYDNSFIYPQSMQDDFVAMAQRVGQIVNIERYDPCLGGDMGALQRGLFSCEKPTAPSRSGQVKLYVADDVEQEIKHVARQINSLIRSGEARYKDIAIVCPDFEGYGDEIYKIFQDYGVSYYCDVKTPLITQALPKTLYAAIKAKLSGYGQREVLAYAKSPLTGLDYEDVCIFENYCLEKGVEYGKFLDKWEIECVEDERAERVRAYLMDSLSKLDIDVKTVAEASVSVNAFLIACDLEKKNQALAQKQSQEGLSVESAVTVQCYDKVKKILDQAVGIMGDTAMDMDKFLSVLFSAIAGAEVSTTPLYVDSVFVGDMTSSRYEDVKYMFVLGANENCFPSQSAGNGIVAERESTAWAKSGVVVEPDVKARNRMQKLNILTTLLKAEKRLTISYALKDSLMQPCTCSSTLEYIGELCGVEILNVDDWTNVKADDRLRLLSTDGNILQEFIEMVRLTKNNMWGRSDEELDLLDKVYTIACKKHGREYVDGLLTEDRHTSSQIDVEGVAWNKGSSSASQFECYFNCPFKHYANYVLKLRRREEAKLEVSDLGTYLHAIAEQYFTDPKCCEYTPDEQRVIVYEIYDKLCQENKKLAILTSQPTGMSLKNKITSRAWFMIQKLTQKMQYTKFRPYACEKKFGFGEEGDLPAVAIDNGNRVINIKGIIDRIDTYQDKFFVIDYKSKSHIDFKPKNVLFGDRIQMLIYIMAVATQKSFTPAGMFYVLMNDKYVNPKDDAEKRFRYVGYVDASEDNIADLDNRLTQDADVKSDLFDLKRTVSAKGSKLSGSILTSKEIEATCDYVKKLIAKAAKEIDEGYAEPKPLKDGCKYCDYKNMCGFEQMQRQERDFESIKIAKMIELVTASEKGGEDDRLE